MTIVVGRRRREGEGSNHKAPQTQHCKFKGSQRAVAAWEFRLSICSDRLSQSSSYARARSQTPTIRLDIHWSTRSLLALLLSCVLSMSSRRTFTSVLRRATPMVQNTFSLFFSGQVIFNHVNFCFSHHLHSFMITIFVWMKTLRVTR